MANTENNVFIVVHRRLDDDKDVVQLVPRLFIMQVPDGVDIPQLKCLLEAAGIFHREQWREYRVYDPDELTDSVGDFRPDDESEEMDYNFLVQEANAEKRVTLRLPLGLYAALDRKTKRISFNQLCINLLSSAIGYGDVSAKPQDK